MPISTKLDAVNLALDHLGEPYLTNLETDQSVAGQAARLHFDHTLHTVLESFHWSFAKRFADVEEAEISPYFYPPDAVYMVGGTIPEEGKGLLVPTSNENRWTDDGSDLEFGIIYPNREGATWTRALSFSAAFGTFFYYYVAEGMVYGYAATPEVDPYTLDQLPSITGWISQVAEEDGPESTGIPAFSIPSGIYIPGFLSAFELPDDYLRLTKVDNCDVGGETEFDIIDGTLLFRYERDAPAIEYITKNPPIEKWPSTFTDAFCLLLASRMAMKVVDDQNLADALLAKYQQALGKATLKDSQETRSAENFGPRHLAARSAFVQSRFGGRRMHYPPPPTA